MFGGVKPQVSSFAGLSRPEIRSQLERVLASETFRRSERLSGLLSYVVERTLQGEQHIIKEQTIAQEYFGRGADLKALETRLYGWKRGGFGTSCANTTRKPTAIRF